MKRDHHAGRAERTLAAAERDTEALTLREGGASYREIARLATLDARARGDE